LDGLNLYCYVCDAPTLFRDRLGHEKTRTLIDENAIYNRETHYTTITRETFVVEKGTGKVEEAFRETEVRNEEGELHRYTHERISQKVAKTRVEELDERAEEERRREDDRKAIRRVLRNEEFMDAIHEASELTGVDERTLVLMAVFENSGLAKVQK